MKYKPSYLQVMSNINNDGLQTKKPQKRAEMLADSLLIHAASISSEALTLYTAIQNKEEPAGIAALTLAISCSEQLRNLGMFMPAHVKALFDDLADKVNELASETIYDENNDSEDDEDDEDDEDEDNSQKH